MRTTLSSIAKLLLIGESLLGSPGGWCQEAVSIHGQIKALVDEHAREYRLVSKQIWDAPELGYHEEKSSGLLQKHLRDAGFTLQKGVAEEPTAFIASYGQGKPVIAILGEFDALPALSQQTVPERRPVEENAPGHGCGHNLLGSGAALAAVAIKDYMEKNHVPGTLRLYGTPAEEGGSGKVYMVHHGLFNDVDVVLHWHPYDRNAVLNGGMIAAISAKFTFHGTAAHASFSPDRGRSALDAVMLMGNGIEFMREHVSSGARMQYTITKGGAAPNVVPDLAEMYLTARHPSMVTLASLWERVLSVAQGATLMTGTTVSVNVIQSDANLLPNDVLAALAQKNLGEVGGYRLSEDQLEFAKTLQATLQTSSPEDLNLTQTVQPLEGADPNGISATLDVGDVSWTVPTIGIMTASFVPGVSPHTWQAAASSGMSIGQDGMVSASKVLAITALDLFSSPRIIEEAKADLKKNQAGKTFKSAIRQDQKPVLDYREN